MFVQCSYNGLTFVRRPNPKHFLKSLKRSLNVKRSEWVNTIQLVWTVLKKFNYPVLTAFDDIYGGALPFLSSRIHFKVPRCLGFIVKNKKQKHELVRIPDRKRSDSRCTLNIPLGGKNHPRLWETGISVLLKYTRTFFMLALGRIHFFHHIAFMVNAILFLVQSEIFRFHIFLSVFFPPGNEINWLVREWKTWHMLGYTKAMHYSRVFHFYKSSLFHGLRIFGNCFSEYWTHSEKSIICTKLILFYFQNLYLNQIKGFSWFK